MPGALFSRIALKLPNNTHFAANAEAILYHFDDPALTDRPSSAGHPEIDFIERFLPFQADIWLSLASAASYPLLYMNRPLLIVAHGEQMISQAQMDAPEIRGQIRYGAPISIDLKKYRISQAQVPPPPVIPTSPRASPPLLAEQSTVPSPRLNPREGQSGENNYFFNLVSFISDEGHSFLSEVADVPIDSFYLSPIHARPAGLHSFTPHRFRSQFGGWTDSVGSMNFIPNHVLIGDSRPFATTQLASLFLNRMQSVYYRKSVQDVSKPAHRAYLEEITTMDILHLLKTPSGCTTLSDILDFLYEIGIQYQEIRIFCCRDIEHSSANRRLEYNAEVGLERRARDNHYIRELLEKSKMSQMLLDNMRASHKKDCIQVERLYVQECEIRKQLAIPYRYTSSEIRKHHKLEENLRKIQAKMTQLSELQQKFMFFLRNASELLEELEALKRKRDELARRGVNFARFKTSGRWKEF